MSTSVKTRKMTANKGVDNRKGSSHRTSPKMTKYLQNLGVNKTPITTTDITQTTMPTPNRSTQQKEQRRDQVCETQTTMPTPTRGAQHKDKSIDQVCETLYQSESGSEAEIESVNSDTLRDEEDSDDNLPFNTLGELEEECREEIDPRTITVTTETIPVILVSMLKTIDKMEETSLAQNKENLSLKYNISSLEKTMIEQDSEIRKLTTDIIKIKESQNESDKENNNLKSSLDFAYIKIADLENKEKERVESEKKVRENIEMIKGDNKKLKVDNTKMKEKNIKAEAYSRRSNLRFEGIPTSPDETNVQCRNKVYDFLKTNLGMVNAEKNIVIERCHRDPKYPNQNPASIIARFLSFNDRQEVWEARNRVNRDRNNRLFINEDFPQEVEKKRSFLRPYVKAAYANKMKATLLGDTLLVEGNRYSVDELHLLPEAMRPEKTVVKTDGKVTVFFRKDAFLSNFHAAPMTVNDEQYNCVEQFYMAAKAEKFDDREALQKIMASSNPNEINFLGKNVKNFKQNIWNEISYEIMKKGVRAKFTQNPQLATFLENTGKTQIGEGSEKDMTWGTGVSVFHQDAFNTDKWKGKNHLGKILMEIRNALRPEHPQN